MAWEARRNGKQKYYYRHRRVNGRAVKQYVGRGSAAEEAARETAQAAADRAADQTAACALETRMESLDQLGNELDELVERFLEANLLSHGCYEHRGQWRRRHVCQRNQSDA